MVGKEQSFPATKVYYGALFRSLLKEGEPVKIFDDKNIEKAKKIFNAIANGICEVSLVVIVIVMMTVVVTRYCFNFTPAWSEELCLFLLTWVGLFSSCIAENDNSHIRLTFIDGAFPPKVLHVFGIIRYLLKMMFFGLMTYYGIKIFGSTKQMFGAIKISYKWQILPGIFTGAFCLIFLLLKTKKIFTDKHEHDKENQLEEILNG